MVKILEKLGELVISVGGIGVITVAVSSYISKISAELFMKKKFAEYDKKVQEEIEKCKAMNEQISHKNNILFDKEFDIYVEFIPKLLASVDDILKLLNRKYDNDTHKDICSKLTELKSISNKLAAFIDEKIYDLLLKFIQDVRSEVVDVHNEKESNFREDSTYERRAEKAQEIITCKEMEIIKELRSYLKDKSELEQRTTNYQY